MVIALEILVSNLRKDQIDNQRVFFALQAILNHSANISKIIWGAPGKSTDKVWKEARLKIIQDLLSLDDTSLLHHRVMRNNLEHFDDRLDTWSSTFAARGNFVDNIIGSPNSVEIQGAGSGVFFRQYDPSTHTMYFLNDELNIQALVIEVQRIGKLARQQYASLR